MAAPPARYRLMRDGEDPNHVPWLERFDAWAAGRGVHDRHWIPHEHAQSPRWHVTLKLNGHIVPDFVGRGDTVQGAKANLIRQLETAEPAVFTIPLLPAFHNHP